MMIDPQLGEKVAIVSGANHGIGAATARALAAQGVKVLVTYFLPDCSYSEEELREARRAGVASEKLYRANQQQSAQQTIEVIRGNQGCAVAYETDLGNADNIPKLFELCERELGPADILVNNHTHCVFETFDQGLVSEGAQSIQLPTAQSIDRHFAVNARGYALLMKEFLARYLKRGGSTGRIVNVSTDAAHAHSANISYAASKHAAESYSRSAATEMGKYGITVNIVSPGPIQTGYIPPDTEREIGAKIPLRRIGQPEDVADVIVFLASEQARWVTGQLIYVGGGWRMHQ